MMLAPLPELLRRTDSPRGRTRHIVSLDDAVRTSAFAFLREESSRNPEGLLPYKTLLKGFEFRGSRIPLIGPQGIFKPALLDLPLSINTAPPKPGKEKPYQDVLTDDGDLEYCYRGTDPSHRDNVGLRTLMAQQRPLIYLHGIVPGLYAAQYPVYIVGDEPGRLRFRVDLERAAFEAVAATGALVEPTPQKKYGTALVLRRLHQAAFRERVLSAYREHCAICRLRHRELLDAAHILPDPHPQSTPSVENGLALCKLHHAAFDVHILGIRPDHIVEIRRDILEEIDGPMLLHGLKEFQESRLVLPRSKSDWPRTEFLEARYEVFRKAG